MTSWTEAAKRYQDKSPEAQRAVRDQETNQAILDLGTFINSPEGLAAIQLLEASKRFIRIAEYSEGGRAVVYFIDGKGLRRSCEASGLGAAMTAASTGEKPQPNITSMSAIEFVEGIDSCDEKPPLSEIVKRIREGLDEIAAAAP